MASRISTLESHPQRARLIEAVLSGLSLRQVAAGAVPPIHPAVLGRFVRQSKRAVSRTIDAASDAIANNSKGDTPAVRDAVSRAVLTATATAAADPFLARVMKHHQVIDRSLAVAEADEDGRTVAALISADRGSLELGARLAGRLDNASAAQSLTMNQIIIMPSDRDLSALADVIDVTPAPSE